MRKQLLLVSSLLLILSTLTVIKVHAKIASETNKVITVKVNNVDLVTDVQPYINENGHAMVPVRFLSEIMGYEIGWIGNDKTVVLNNYYGDTLKVKVGENKVVINQEVISMEDKAVMKESRVFVPVNSFYGDTIHGAIELDGANNVLSITNWGPTKELLQIYKMFPGSKPFGFDLYCSLDGKADNNKYDFSFTTDVQISDTSCTFVVENFNDAATEAVKKVLAVYYSDEYEKVFEVIKQSKNSAEPQEVYFKDRALVIFYLEDNRLQLDIGQIGIKEKLK